MTSPANVPSLLLGAVLKENPGPVLIPVFPPAPAPAAPAAAPPTPPVVATPPAEGLVPEVPTGS